MAVRCLITTVAQPAMDWNEPWWQRTQETYTRYSCQPADVRLCHLGLVWTFRGNHGNIIFFFFFFSYRKWQDLDSSVLDFVSWVLLVSTAKKEPANQRLIVNEYACTGTNSWIFVNTHVQTLAGHGQESNVHWTHTGMHTDKGTLNRPLLELIIK